MVFPEPVSDVLIGLLAAALGFLCRELFAVRTRLAVVEARERIRDDKLEEYGATLKEIDKKLDGLALDVARGNSLNKAGGID